MRLQEFLKNNNIEDSICEKIKVEYKAMTFVDMERYSDDVQKKCKRRIEELTINKVIDDFFYVANGNEGKMFEIVCNYGYIPKYISTYRFGKLFALRLEGDKVKGCYYKAT